MSCVFGASLSPYDKLLQLRLRAFVICSPCSFQGGQLNARQPYQIALFSLFSPSERRKPIREALERARERVDYAIGRLKSFEEVRCLRWRCIDCGYVKKFTRLMPAEVAPPCAKCGGDQFQAFG
jgi:hypothetical protein